MMNPDTKEESQYLSNVFPPQVPQRIRLRNFFTVQLAYSSFDSVFT